MKFNGTSVTETPVIVSNTQIKAKVPAGATTGPIQVTVTGGATAAGVALFKVTPKITGFDPAAAPAGAGVLVQGTTLDGATSLKFNGVSAAIESDDGSTIATHVPVSATTGLVTVTTPGGTSSLAFKVLPVIEVDV